MKLCVKSSVLALLLCLAAVCPSHGDAPLVSRGALPPASDLADRIVIDRYLKGDVLGVIRWASLDEATGPSSRYYLGETYSSLGMVSRAASAYMQALQEGTPEDSWWPDALIRYLELLELSPDLPALEIRDELDRDITGYAALYFGSYLQRKGDPERASKLLRSNYAGTVETRALSTAAVARIQADADKWEQSLATLSSFRTSETSTVTDLIYLLKGYAYLEVNKPQQAREAFLTIPPSSPFSSEAIFGQAWALIKAGDLPKAAVRFQELIDQHPYTSAARDAIVDLSLTFRELGLYDSATDTLTRESEKLREMSGWLRSLDHSDFKTGGDLLVLIEGGVNDTRPDQVIIDRTPRFVMQWVLTAGKDQRVRRTTSLLNGVNDLEEKLEELVARHLSAIELIQQEVSWADNGETVVKDINQTLANASDRLPAYMDQVLSSLEQGSLEEFASETSMSILGKTASLQNRLKTMEINVEKIRSFPPVISGLKDSPSVTQEEQQLNRIRENAYKGLVKSRNSLRDLRSDLKGLEGRIWLHVKGEARRTESGIYERVAAAKARIEEIRAKNEKAQNMLTVRLSLLSGSRDELSTRVDRLNTVLSGNLSDLNSELRTLQTATFLQVADETRNVLEEEEALAMFTAADIEIMKMEINLRAMQDAIP